MNYDVISQDEFVIKGYLIPTTIEEFSKVMSIDSELWKILDNEGSLLELYKLSIDKCIYSLLFLEDNISYQLIGVITNKNLADLYHYKVMPSNYIVVDLINSTSDDVEEVYSLIDDAVLNDDNPVVEIEVYKQNTVELWMPISDKSDTKVQYRINTSARNQLKYNLKFN